MADKVITLEHFTAVTTRAARKVHFAEEDWIRRTLCGHAAFPLDNPGDADVWAECGQCVKSRARRIEGRPS